MERRKFLKGAAIGAGATALAPHLAASGSARKRFAREAKAAAAILHPNVIAIHGVSNDQRLPYLVMPLIPGESLQKRIEREGPLPLNDILRIGAQVAGGLGAAHAQGLIHRDIKPANVLLESGTERVTITDFGLARAVDDATMTRSCVIAGTPQYMSPEQTQGRTLSQSSDLFSLGSVLYTLCTGRAPFRSETTFGVMRRITDEEPSPINELNPEIPIWFCQIVEQLMSKKPTQRYDSANTVCRLLSDCLAHVQHPTQMSLPASLDATLSNPVQAKPARSALVATGFLAFGFLAIMLWQSSAPPNISGKWKGENWPFIEIAESKNGKYTGAFIKNPHSHPQVACSHCHTGIGLNSSFSFCDFVTNGTFELKWSRLEHRFNGSWRHPDGGSGKLSLRRVDGEIRGVRTTAKKLTNNAANPRYGDFVWRPSKKVAPKTGDKTEPETSYGLPGWEYDDRPTSNLKDTSNSSHAAETAELKIRVTDSYGNPIEGATLFADGLRLHEAGGHWQWPKKHIAIPDATTNAEGFGILKYPTHIDENGDVADGRLPSNRVAKLTVTVAHDRYVGTYKDVKVDRETTFVLKAGKRIELHLKNPPKNPNTRLGVWLVSSPTEVVAEPNWSQPSSGVLATNGFPPIGGKVMIVAASSSGQHSFSDVLTIDSRVIERGKLEEITLSPGLKQKGKLSDNVPRPIANGRALIAVQVIDVDPDSAWYDWVKIDDDGTFVFEGLPDGTQTQVIAYCDGWSSVNLGGNTGFVSGTKFLLSPNTQHVALMQPTFEFDIRVIDQDGKSIPGITVGTYPNEQYFEYSSCAVGQLYDYADWYLRPHNSKPYEYAPVGSWRTFESITDKSGRCKISGIPHSGPYEELYVTSDDYVLANPSTNGGKFHESKSGETTKVVLVVKNRMGKTITQSKSIDPRSALGSTLAPDTASDRQR